MNYKWENRHKTLYVGIKMKMTETIIIFFILATICLFASACTKSKKKQLVSEGKVTTVVHVEFINGNDQTVVTKSDMLLEQLPDSFRIDTTLEMTEKKWSVVSADPTDKAEFFIKNWSHISIRRLFRAYCSGS